MSTGWCYVGIQSRSCRQKRPGQLNATRSSHCSSGTWSAGPVYSRDSNLLSSSVSADGLAPIGARPSADTVLRTKSDLFSSLVQVMVWSLAEQSPYLNRFDLSSLSFSCIQLQAISHDLLQTAITEMFFFFFFALKKHMEFQTYYPGTNELT